MSFLSFVSYWVWPNPGNAHYSSPKVQFLLVVCGLMVAAGPMLSYARSRLRNPMTRTLTASWAMTSFSFGLVGAVLVVSRVEMIQFLAMRILWLLWALLLSMYIVFQFVRFQRRHYVIMEKQLVVDVRDKYLPRKKGY